jgi:pimeloyl-ACP methyl ester carboxylesterase
MKTEANGIKLNVETWGEGGTTVLLVHGLGGCLEQWHGVAALLAPTCRVIAPDLRGHGTSDRTGPYSQQGFAQDLAGLCKSLKVERCVAVGASMSGAVVLQLAADRPGLVQGLVTVGGFASLPPAGKERMAQRADLAERQGMAAVADLVVGAALGPSTHARNPGLVGLQKALLLRNDPAAYAAATRAVVATDAHAALSGVKCPVRLVFGVEEKVSPLPMQAALKRGLPQAELRAIPEAGHLPFLEQPQAFAAALMEFVAALG